MPFRRLSLILLVLLSTCCAFARFNPPVKLDLRPFQPRLIGASDLNQDGIMDIVVSCSTVEGGTRRLTLVVFLGQADGTYTRIAKRTRFDYDFEKSLDIGDLNLDGFPDVVVTNASLYIFFGNGDGTLQDAAEYLHDGAVETYANIADFNEDGLLDVAESVAVDPLPVAQVRILLNRGDGTLEEGYSHVSGPGYGGRIAIGDLNGDGHLDLITNGIAFDVTGVRIFLGHGDGTLEAVDDVGLPVSAVSGFPYIADQNQDGNADIVFVSQRFGNNEILFYPGNGDGSFGTPALTDAQTQVELDTAKFFISPDGKLLLLTNDFAGYIREWAGDVSGTFIPLRDRNGARGLHEMELADVNGDGRKDLLAGDVYGEKLVIFLNRP